jgi:hypothetical protein
MRELELQWLAWTRGRGWGEALHAALLRRAPRSGREWRGSRPDRQVVRGWQWPGRIVGAEQGRPGHRRVGSGPQRGQRRFKLDPNSNPNEFQKVQFVSNIVRPKNALLEKVNNFLHRNFIRFVEDLEWKFREASRFRIWYNFFLELWIWTKLQPRVVVSPSIQPNLWGIVWSSH